MHTLSHTHTHTHTRTHTYTHTGAWDNAAAPPQGYAATLLPRKGGASNASQRKGPFPHSAYAFPPQPPPSSPPALNSPTAQVPPSVPPSALSSEQRASQHQTTVPHNTAVSFDRGASSTHNSHLAPPCPSHATTSTSVPTSSVSAPNHPLPSKLCQQQQQQQQKPAGLPPVGPTPLARPPGLRWTKLSADHRISSRWVSMHGCDDV
jgi:hypothetical protein